MSTMLYALMNDSEHVGSILQVENNELVLTIKDIGIDINSPIKIYSIDDDETVEIAEIDLISLIKENLNKNNADLTGEYFLLSYKECLGSLINGEFTKNHNLNLNHDWDIEIYNEAEEHVISGIDMYELIFSTIQ